MPCPVLSLGTAAEVPLDLKNTVPSGGTDAKKSELCERNACGGRHAAAARSETPASFCPFGLRTPPFFAVSYCELMLRERCKRRYLQAGRTAAAHAVLLQCSLPTNQFYYLAEQRLSDKMCTFAHGYLCLVFNSKITKKGLTPANGINPFFLSHQLFYRTAILKFTAFSLKIGKS